VSSIRVLLVDDDEDVCDGVRLLLDRGDGIEIVGEARNGHAAIEMTRRLRPDVVVTDIAHPGPDGYAVTEAVTEQVDGVKVVIFSGYAASTDVQRSWRAGARGFVAKPESVADLARAIKMVAAGGEFLSPGLSLVGPPACTTPPAARRFTPDW
jgi:DNA-binding NarL/FixJ family response regulator